MKTTVFATPLMPEPAAPPLSAPRLEAMLAHACAQPQTSAPATASLSLLRSKTIWGGGFALALSLAVAVLLTVGSPAAPTRADTMADAADLVTLDVLDGA